MNPRAREWWPNGSALVLWSVIILGVVRIASRPASTPRSVPGAGTWNLVERFDRPKVGALVPELTLFNRDGWRCPLSGYRGRRMLLCFFRSETPDTPLVREWERIHRSSAEVVVLGISVSGPGGGPNPLLSDPNYRFTKHRKSVEYPLTAVVDEKGKVIYVSHKQDNVSAVIRKLRVGSRGGRPIP